MVASRREVGIIQLYGAAVHRQPGAVRLSSHVMRTQVAIIGAGPAGLFLAPLLRRRGIDTTVLERRDRAYVEGRVRAGVLEQITMDVLAVLGLDGRMYAQGLLHDGTNLVSDGEMFRIDMAERSGGRRVMVYGQQEVMHDLFEAA